MCNYPLPCAVFAVAAWVSAPAIAAHVLELSEQIQGSAVLALRLGALAVVARVLGNVLNTPELVRLRWDLYVIVTNGSGTAQIVLVPIVVFMGAGVGGAVGVIVVASGTAA